MKRNRLKPIKPKSTRHLSFSTPSYIDDIRFLGNQVDRTEENGKYEVVDGFFFDILNWKYPIYSASLMQWYQISYKQARNRTSRWHRARNLFTRLQLHTALGKLDSNIRSWLEISFNGVRIDLRGVGSSRRNDSTESHFLSSILQFMSMIKYQIMRFIDPILDSNYAVITVFAVTGFKLIDSYAPKLLNVAHSFNVKGWEKYKVNIYGQL